MVALEEVPVGRKGNLLYRFNGSASNEELRTISTSDRWNLRRNPFNWKEEGECIPYIECESNGNNEDDNTKEKNENECIYYSIMFWFMSTSAMKRNTR